MKLVYSSDGLVEVELTRRNLTALLQKLDAKPGLSSRTLVKGNLYVRAVEDEEHYDSEHPPGPMRNPETGEVW